MTISYWLGNASEGDSQIEPYVHVVREVRASPDGLSSSSFVASRNGDGSAPGSLGQESMVAWSSRAEGIRRPPKASA